MKKILIVTFLLFMGLASTVSAAESGDAQYSPNDIYKILFAGLGKETALQPTTELKFGENANAKIDKVLQELPFPKGKVSQGKIEKERYRQINYDNFWTVYSTGEGGEWDQKLFAVSFSINLKNQNVQEKETSVFLKLNQMYGECTALSKFIYNVGQFEPKLNYYIWKMVMQLLLIVALKIKKIPY